MADLAPPGHRPGDPPAPRRLGSSPRRRSWSGCSTSCRTWTTGSGPRSAARSTAWSTSSCTRRWSRSATRLAAHWRGPGEAVSVEGLTSDMRTLERGRFTTALQTSVRAPEPRSAALPRYPLVASRLPKAAMNRRTRKKPSAPPFQPPPEGGGCSRPGPVYPEAVSRHPAPHPQENDHEQIPPVRVRRAGRPVALVRRQRHRRARRRRPRQEKLKVLVVSGGHGFPVGPFRKVFEGYQDMDCTFVDEKTGGEAFEDIEPLGLRRHRALQLHEEALGQGVEELQVAAGPRRGPGNSAPRHLRLPAPARVHEDGRRHLLAHRRQGRRGHQGPRRRPQAPHHPGTGRLHHPRRGLPGRTSSPRACT